MALFDCPECGKSVSDKAVVCVNCGFPLSKTRSKNLFTKLNDKTVFTTHKIRIIMSVFIFVIVLCSIALAYRYFGQAIKPGQIVSLRNATYMTSGTDDYNKLMQLIRDGEHTIAGNLINKEQGFYRLLPGTKVRINSFTGKYYRLTIMNDGTEGFSGVSLISDIDKSIDHPRNAISKRDFDLGNGRVILGNLIQFLVYNAFSTWPICLLFFSIMHKTSYNRNVWLNILIDTSVAAVVAMFLDYARYKVYLESSDLSYFPTGSAGIAVFAILSWCYHNRISKKINRASMMD